MIGTRHSNECELLLDVQTLTHCRQAAAQCTSEQLQTVRQATLRGLLAEACTGGADDFGGGRAGGAVGSGTGNLHHAAALVRRKHTNDT